MSKPSIYEAQQAFWEDYVVWCGENNIPATYDGFSVWLSDSDMSGSDFDG